MNITTTQRIKFEVTREDNSYVFDLPHGAALSEAMQACATILSAISALETKKMDAPSKEKEEGLSE
jgi:hypothetical protein